MKYFQPILQPGYFAVFVTNSAFFVVKNKQRSNPIPVTISLKIQISFSSVNFSTQAKTSI